MDPSGSAAPRLDGVGEAGSGHQLAGWRWPGRSGAHRSAGCSASRGSHSFQLLEPVQHEVHLAVDPGVGEPLICDEAGIAGRLVSTQIHSIVLDPGGCPWIDVVHAFGPARQNSIGARPTCGRHDSPDRRRPVRCGVPVPIQDMPMFCRGTREPIRPLGERRKSSPSATYSFDRPRFQSCSRGRNLWTDPGGGVT